jgi:hypothetical protein
LKGYEADGRLVAGAVGTQLEYNIVSVGNLERDEARHPFRPHRTAAEQRRWQDERVARIVGEMGGR